MLLLAYKIYPFINHKFRVAFLCRTSKKQHWMVNKSTTFHFPLSIYTWLRDDENFLSTSESAPLWKQWLAGCCCSCTKSLQFIESFILQYSSTTCSWGVDEVHCRCIRWVKLSLITKAITIPHDFYKIPFFPSVITHLLSFN